MAEATAVLEHDGLELVDGQSGPVGQLLGDEASEGVRNLGPTDIGDPAEAPRGIQHRSKSVRADQHGGNAPPFD
jgi:hypothetical protein